MSKARILAFSSGKQRCRRSLRSRQRPTLKIQMENGRCWLWRRF
jgi:hypothetical protein